MKKKLIGFAIPALALLPVLWLSQGCKGTLPAIPAVVPTPLPAGVISDFNNGTLNMNPSLLNGNGGYFLPETYGGAPGHTNMINGNTNPNILIPDPGDGSAYAIHVYGPQSDPAPTNYPAMEVFGFLKNNPSNPYYDVTPFIGVRFDMNIPSDETDTQKLFGIACAPMVPPTTDQGGTCPPPFSNNCYNYFWYNSPTNSFGSIQGKGWQPVSFLFSSLKTDANYGTIKGATFTSTYQKETLFLLWKFGDNGGGANTYTDFWVDNVQFY